jgi:hypothetical protein
VVILDAVGRGRMSRDVRSAGEVPRAESTTQDIELAELQTASLFDHLIGEREQLARDRSERSRAQWLGMGDKRLAHSTGEWPSGRL